MPDLRLMLCEHCGSEGRLYSGEHDDERDRGPCPACDGTGMEIVETKPIAFADLMVMGG